MCGQWGNDFSLHKGTILLFCLLPLFFFLSFPSFLSWITEKESEKGWFFSASLLVSPGPNHFYPSCLLTNVPFPLSPLNISGLQRANNITERDSAFCATNVRVCLSDLVRIQIWYLRNWEQDLILSVEECISGLALEVALLRSAGKWAIVHR